MLIGNEKGGVLRLLVIVVLLVTAAAAYLAGSQSGRITLVRLFATESTPRQFAAPAATDWQPTGVRRFSSNPHPAARPVTFGRALHTDLHGSDEIATAIAPMFELDWTVEKNMFIPEGPVFDSKGNIYFSPIFPPEDVLLVSIDGTTGERRWVISGTEAGGAGTPLIINDAEADAERVYTVTYERAIATDINGKVLWDEALEALPLQSTDNQRHCFGANYHIQSDSIIGVMGNGQIQVLDRLTGKTRLAKPFQMPGAPTAVTNFSLPERISKAANIDIKHMVSSRVANNSPIEAVLHAAAGELQQVTNFFSIDSNTGRIWVASTLPDDADGKKDGWSDFAGLYGLELVEVEGGLEIVVAVVAKVPGGTASTPALSADGTRVYVADAFHSVYAIDTSNGERLWAFDVGDKVTGSIDVASDNGEIYANTRAGILQLLDRGDHATLGWEAQLDMYKPGRFQRNVKALGAEIGANGVAFTGAAGIMVGKQKFPFRLGAGLIDRKTGKLRYFVDGAEDSVSSMVTGPDGGLYVGNSPLRRVLGRATFGKSISPQPVVGGITRFKPVRYDLFLRDVLKASMDRASNAVSILSTAPAAVAADVFHINQLLQQSQRVGQEAVKEGSLSGTTWHDINIAIAKAQGIAAPENSALTTVVTLMSQALTVLENDK